MARPFTASDDEILLAARNVITKRGPDAFSIKEVASEVGLSRAAIILRFKSTHALKVASLEKLVQQFADVLEASLPKTPSGDNLLQLAAFIGSYTRSRESSMRFFSNFYASNVRDRELLSLELKRGAALDAAISRVMPESAIEHASAVLAFRAHLTGSILAWLTRDDADARNYLIERTCDWLTLARIPFDAQVAAELATPQPTKPARPRTASARAKTKRASQRSKRTKSATAD